MDVCLINFNKGCLKFWDPKFQPIEPIGKSATDMWGLFEELFRTPNPPLDLKNLAVLFSESLDMSLKSITNLQHRAQPSHIYFNYIMSIIDFSESILHCIWNLKSLTIKNKLHELSLFFIQRAKSYMNGITKTWW